MRQEKQASDDKFTRFKKDRHHTPFDTARREERVKGYGDYNPGEDSMFHAKNRGYNQKDLNASREARAMGWDQFKIQKPTDFKKTLHFSGMKVEKTKADKLFEEAYGKFNQQSHESTNRARLKDKDVMKMLNVTYLFGGLVALGGLKKGVDAVVR